MKRFVNTAAPLSSEELALMKIDEVIAAYASLKASHDALIEKLNSDTGVSDIDYTSTAKAAPKKASDELI